MVAAVDELWRRRILREFRDGYDFSHDLLRETAYAQVSPPQALAAAPADRAGPGAAARRRHRRGRRPARRAVRPRRAARAGGRLLPAGRRGRGRPGSPTPRRSGCTRRRWRSSTAMPAGPGPRPRRSSRSSRRSRRRSTPGTATRRRELQRTLERSVVAGRVARPQGLDRHRPGRAVDDAVRPGPHRRQLPAGARALALAEPESELAARRTSRSAASAVSLGQAGRGPASPRAGRQAGQRRGAAEHRHPARRARRGLGRARPLAARPRRRRPRRSCQQAIELARADGHPYSLAVALAYGGITHQMRDDLPGLRDAVAELRELCERYDFAYYREWALILDGWSRPGALGHRPGPGAASATSRPQGSFARMPYWLSLLADLLAARRPARRRAGHARRRARGRAGPRRPVVAARGHADARRLRRRRRTRGRAAARGRASSRPRHGSVALLRRCEHDLAAAAFAVRAGVRRAADESARANAARTLPVLLRRYPATPGHRPKGTRMTTSADITTAPLRRAGRRPARRADHAGGPRLRRGPRRLQRHDRQAPGRDRALPRRRRRHRLRALRPRPRHRARRPRRRAQRRRPRGRGRRPRHRPVAAAQHHRQTRRTTPSASTPAAPGATSTTRPWRSAWPPRPASWPPPASPA